jgi:hypothetical protein
MWKPFNTLKPYERMPVLHWSYRWNFFENTHNTAFIPIAIVLGLLLALKYSAEHFWREVVIETQRKLKDEAHNG